MKIIVKNTIGEKFYLDVEPTDDIYKIKQNEQLQKDLIFNDKLIYAGEELENSKTLQDYKIINESTLHLVTREIRKVLFVKTMLDKTLTIDIDLNNTVRELKEKIQHREGIPVHLQRIVFRSLSLENCKIIKDLKISYESTLFLVLRLRGGMYHETSSRSTFDSTKPFIVLNYEQNDYNMVKINVDFNSLISDIKLQLQNVENINIEGKDLYSYFDDELNDTCTLSSLSITNGALIFLR